MPDTQGILVVRFPHDIVVVIQPLGERDSTAEHPQVCLHPIPIKKTTLLVAASQIAGVVDRQRAVAGKQIGNLSLNPVVPKVNCCALRKRDCSRTVDRFARIFGRLNGTERDNRILFGATVKLPPIVHSTAAHSKTPCDSRTATSRRRRAAKTVLMRKLNFYFIDGRLNRALEM